MDDNTARIIIALISSASTIFGAIVTYLVASRKQSIKDAKREQKQQDTFEKLFYELDGVKKRLDCHNGYAKKFEENSRELAIINNKITGIQKDIDYLKSDRCKV